MATATTTNGDHARDVFWRTVQEPGFEHLLLTEHVDGVDARGLVLGVFDTPWRGFRLRYRVRCDARWRVRELDVELEHPWSRTVALRSDGEGSWRDATGGAREDLRGCIDADVMTTPFTNTLPIRRLPWAPGATHDITLTYVAVPSLEVTVERQRYTCRSRDADGARFGFESLESGFTAELLVDRDGLVVEYSDIFARVPVE